MNPPFVAAGIFGSFAIGDADPDSDIDLILFYKGKHKDDLPDREELYEEIRRHGVGFDPNIHLYLELDKDELSSRKDKIQWMIKKGFIVIAENEEDRNLITKYLT